MFKNLVILFLFKDFKILVDASIHYLIDRDKFEKYNNLNNALVQVDNSKEISKWLLKVTSLALKINIEPSKISKYLQLNYGLDESKSNIIKESVHIHFNMHFFLFLIF
jgi:hypothetical protein